MGPAFGRNSEFFYNPLITKVQVPVEGISNQLYAQGMLPYHHWDEIAKECSREGLKDAELPSTDISTYFRSRYALWLDFRSSDDRKLHGSGRRGENASEGLRSCSIRMSRLPADSSARYTFLMDAQLNIGDGRLTSSVF